MKDILIIANFVSINGEPGNCRFAYIADMLSKERVDVNIELITSTFSHLEKKQREINKEKIDCLNYKINLIYEPGYGKNVSLKRFYSHYILSRNLKKYLKGRKKPDIIYCAIPSLDIGYVAAKYAQKNDIKFIIDIQDLWPESFKMVFKIPIINEIIFKPMEYIANYIYKSANEIIAVSNTYLNRARKVNKCNGKSIFLGTDLKQFDSISNYLDIEKDPNEIWVTYVGTLGHSYDLITVIDAISDVYKQGITNIKLVVMGNGPLEKKVREYANEKNIKTLFKGRLPYDEMVQYLKKCDIAVNPIVKDSHGSIINKVGDYAAAGLPTLNTQESEEYRLLIDKYKCGINCKNGDYKDLSEKIVYLYNNRDKMHEYGFNNRILAEEKFDRNKTYKYIIECF